jgi:integrase/recombinase XerD
MEKFNQFLVLKGLQPVTVIGHVDSVIRIQKRLGVLYPTIEEAKDYVTELYLSDYSYSHKVNQARSLEYFLEYLGTPHRFGRQRKPKRLIKDTLNEAEITRLLFCTRNSREKAVIALLAYGGLRPKEICKLKKKDLNIALGQVRVEQGKGAKDGVVFLTSRCVEILMQYLAEYPREDEDFLFTTLVKRNQYMQQDLRKLTKVLAKRAGIRRRVYPYLMRHSLATNMIKRGANLLYIKEHFRHAWIETTMHYVHSVSVAELQEQFIPSYS